MCEAESEIMNEFSAVTLQSQVMSDTAQAIWRVSHL